MEVSRRQQWIADHVLPWEPEVRRWLRRHSGVLPYDADDLIQEAYARLWVGDLSSVRDGRRYFFGLVRHVLQDQRRRAQVVQIETVSELDVLEIEGTPGPERWAVARERLEQLLTVVQGLAPQRRAVFIARRIEGLSVREISRRLGLKEKTVENHLTYAIAQVTQGMYGHEGPQRQAIEREGGREQATKRD